jgi:hypothetical protein
VPESERQRFLMAVERGLPFEELERLEIIDELRVHLDDSAAALRETGIGPAEAEKTAVDRLGPAEQLADQLTKARLDRSRLLVAAGAGVWGLVRGGVGGYVVALIAAYFGRGLVLAVTSQLVPGSSYFAPLDSSSDRIFAILTVGMALYLAGRMVTPAFVGRAGFVGYKIRLLAVPLGAAVSLAFAALLWTGELNLVTAIAVTLLPLWWIAGSWQTRPFRWNRPGRWSAAIAAVGAVALVASVAMGWYAPGPVPPPLTYEQERAMLERSMNVVVNPHFERIADPTPAVVTAEILIQDGTGRNGTGGAPYEFLNVVMTRASLAGWSELRTEAWRPYWDGFQETIDPTESAPIATGPVQWVSGTTTPDGYNLAIRYSATTWPRTPEMLVGRVLLRPTRQATYFIAITGIAPDGRRHLIGVPELQSAWFDGTALDWFQSALAGK